MDCPTTRGRDVQPVLLALLAWGNAHFAPDGPSVVLLDAGSGARIEPVRVDRVSGKPLGELHGVPAAGPAAGEDSCHHMAPLAAHRAAKPQ
jgi:hypothetical protein